MNLSNIKSEVETNKAHIKPGMTIWYIDAANTERFTVAGVTESELTIVDSDENEDTRNFSSLQFGWQLSNADREMIELLTPA
jgi:hypothetical protein